MTDSTIFIDTYTWTYIHGHIYPEALAKLADSFRFRILPVGAVSADTDSYYKMLLRSPVAIYHSGRKRLLRPAKIGIRQTAVHTQQKWGNSRIILHYPVVPSEECGDDGYSAAGSLQPAFVGDGDAS